jgi:hypothetical protein
MFSNYANSVASYNIKEIEIIGLDRNCIDITYTIGYNQTDLVNATSNKLELLEQGERINDDELDLLATEISIIYDEEIRLEFSYRFDCVLNLNKALLQLNGIHKVKSNIEINEQLKNIHLLISSSFHSPFRTLLEKKYNEKIAINDITEDQNIYHTNSEGILESIINSKTINELDEALCNWYIEEYINIGKTGRNFVCSKILEENLIHFNKDNLKKHIINLIEIYKVNKIKQSEDEHTLSKYPSTLDFDEYKNLLN